MGWFGWNRGALALVLLFLALARPLHGETAPFNIVLDIHDTIVHTSLAEPGTLDTPLVDYGGGEKKQHLSYGLAEFLVAAKNMGAHVSVYSSGMPGGVDPVLNQTILPDGRTAMDLIRETGGKVLYRDSTVPTNEYAASQYGFHELAAKLDADPELGEKLQPEDGRYWGNLKKDLAAHFGPDISRTFFLDDGWGYVLRGEEKNFIRMPWGETVRDFNEYVDSEIQDKKPYLDGIEGELAQRNRLVFALGLIKRAIDKAGDGSAVAAMDESGAKHGFRGEGPSAENFKTLLAGYRLMRAVNPDFKLFRIHFKSFECRLKYAEIAKQQQ